MTTIAILFWTGVFLVFYTYLGYGILLWPKKWPTAARWIIPPANSA